VSSPLKRATEFLLQQRRPRSLNRRNSVAHAVFHRRPVTVAGDRFAPGHLGELTQHLPFEMIDQALTATGSVQTRVSRPGSGTCPPAWWSTSGRQAVCSPNRATRRSGTDWCPDCTTYRWPHPPPGRCAKPHHRIGVAPMRWLFDLLRGPAAGIATTGTRWRGLLVCAIDGTTMTAPDSTANLTDYTKHAGNHGGSGYPRSDSPPWSPAAPAPSSTRCSAPPVSATSSPTKSLTYQPTAQLHGIGTSPHRKGARPCPTCVRW
jgi:hypothetical protein